MRAVSEIEKQGYEVSLEGEKIEIRRKVGFFPNVAIVNSLVSEIRERKPEAIQYLRQRKMSVWCTGYIPHRWVSWDVCMWHKDEDDKICRRCDPSKRKQKEGLLS